MMTSFFTPIFVFFIELKFKINEWGWQQALFNFNQWFCFFKLWYYNKFKLLPSLSSTENAPFSILIINGSEGKVSEVHRVFHLAEKLNLLKISHTITNESTWTKKPIKKLAGFSNLYLHRCRYSHCLNQLVRFYQSQKKSVIYDIDDLFFDPTIIEQIPGIKGWHKFYKKFLEKFTLDIQKLMLKANCIFVSTPFLKKYLQQHFHVSALVLGNHLDEKNYQQGLSIYQNKKQTQSEWITIGYFSGSDKHQLDFAQCESALLTLLARYQNLHLLIVGILTLSPSFAQYKDRIEQVPFLSYQHFMGQYQKIDINIAPLEFTKEFCQAKSELKYFYAGICGIPTVASPTQTFANVIDDEKNGLLAANENEWQLKLERLIKSADLRKRLGDQALRDVEQNYSINTHAQILHKLLQQTTQIS